MYSVAVNVERYVTYDDGITFLNYDIMIAYRTAIVSDSCDAS